MAADRADVGSRLRAAREARGISLRDIATTTKISVSALEALERNDVSRLPGGLFTRAFVRAYAKEVGLDPDQTARDFGESFPPEGETGGVERPMRVRPRAASDSISRAGLGWFGLAITLVLVVVWMGVDRYYTRRTEGTPTRSTSADAPPRPPAAPPMPKPDVPKPPVGDVPPGTAGQPAQTVTGPAQTTFAAPPSSAVPAVKAGQPPTPPAGRAPEEAAPSARAPAPQPPSADATLPLRVVLAAKTDCWVSVSVDGTRVPGRVLKAGEKLDLSAGQSIVLTAGDAGALEYTVNNAPGRALGGPGQVVNVVITPTNYRTYLAARPPQ